MNRNLNRRIHPIAEANGLNPKFHRKGNNPKAKTILGYRNGKLIETCECGKDLCLLIGMNYSTFKYNMKRCGIIFNNIHYIYGDYNRKKISKK